MHTVPRLLGEGRGIELGAGNQAAVSVSIVQSNIVEQSVILK